MSAECARPVPPAALPRCRWYFEQLPAVLKARGAQPFLTKEEMVQLVSRSLGAFCCGGQ